MYNFNVLNTIFLMIVQSLPETDNFFSKKYPLLESEKF